MTTVQNYWQIVVLVLAALFGPLGYWAGQDDARRTLQPTPSPSPLPTPWLWTDANGGAVYVCYSPCTLTNPFQAPPSAEAP